MPHGGSSVARRGSRASSSLCRLCLSARGDTRPIFAADGVTLAERIRACVSVQVDEGDGLPSQICKKCVNNVNNWYAFKKICEDSQLKLKDWVSNDGPLDQDIKIKKEPSFEDDDIIIDGSYPGVDVSEDGNRVRLQPEGPPILASLGLAPRNEKSNKDPRADWDRVVAIQSIIEKDEAVEGTESADEDDVAEVSEADTDSEQELESANEDDEDKAEYRSRDGYIRYSKKKFTRDGGESGESLKRKVIAGCNGDANDAQTPLQAWSLLVTDAMIQNIVFQTNEYIEKYHPSAGITGDPQENQTNMSEIKALVGILYLAGIMRPAFHNSSEMWWSDGCGLGIVQLAMTLDRFKFLLRCLRFNSSNGSDNRKTADDKLHAIRRFFDNFILNCKNAYNFGSCGVVDECILPFEGPCSFKRCIKTKTKTTSGIKMYTLVEPDSFYVGNIEICTFERGINEIAQTRSVNDVVNRLVNHLSHSGITIVTPPRITSFNLVNQLTNDLGMYCVGGLSSKRKEIPSAFYSKRREAYSSTFGFTENGITISSFVTSKKKSHIMISTRGDHYHTHKVSRNGVPGALVWYRQRRNAANVANILSRLYTTSRRCERWSLVIFLSLLDVAAINAQVIWLTNRTQGDVIYRRNFIRSLALELMNDHVRASAVPEDKNTNFELDPLLAVRGGPKKNVSSADAVLRKHRRCKLCPRNADRKTRSYCVSCNMPVCKEHYKQLCICCALKF